jgi:hypothetical protein
MHRQQALFSWLDSPVSNPLSDSELFPDGDEDQWIMSRQQPPQPSLLFSLMRDITYVGNRTDNPAFSSFKMY